MRKKPKIIIKTLNNGITKLYVNGKWKQNISEIQFSAISDYMGRLILCTYSQPKIDKCGKFIIKMGEIVKIKKTVKIES